MREFRFGWAPLLVGLAFAPTAQAQAPSQTQQISSAGAAGPRLVAPAHRVTEAPTINGVLDEREWQQATPLFNFVQAEPFEGQPATEKTEVRILYDDKNIYVGVVCYYKDASQIITTDTRRDFNIDDMDSFLIIFDTYHDRQNGFVFGTNAVGSQYDAQIRNEGETQSNVLFTGASGATSGSGGGVNLNWDASWEVKARISEIGWTAEFAIPLRTLRFGPPPQVWGLNFTRNIRHNREQVYWSPVSRAYNLFRLSSAGELRGLDLKTPRNFKISPYGISTVNRPFTSTTSKTDLNKDWGIDAKYGVTPSMNLDLTYHTDFAQVEADQQQINLTRFNLVFPEKRPFFLENAGLFSVGQNGEIDLFYSRRIGISDTGALVPIKGGARLTGKTNGVNVGLMNMQTDAIDRTPANNFSALRVNKELPHRSSLGAIFTGRTATGDRAGSDDWGRTWGLNGKLGIGEAVTFNGWAAKTETPGFTGRQGAFSGGAEYKTKARRDFVEYTQVGEQFNPEVGFLQRNGGFREISAGWYEYVRTTPILNAGFRELNPHMTYFGYLNPDGSLQTATLHSDFNLDWENGYHAGPAFNIDWDGLNKPFEVYPGVVVPAGRYRAPHTAWVANTDRRKWISANVGSQYGGFLSGHQNSVAPGVTVRRGGKLVTSLAWTRNDIRLPQGAFVTNLGNLRVAYNFSTLINVQSLIQYNDRTKRWSTNLRFSWLDTASTGLFLVYNDTESLNGLGPVSRAFILKYSRQFDVLH